MAAAASTATPQVSSKSPTIRRILREAAEMSTSPSSEYAAEPLESDLFEWHFILRGPPNSPYSQGLYHGRIVLPPTYPLRPPSFRFTTPNGRFEANREICLNISGHHEETWQPAWGIRTALVALRSFMEADARGHLGGLDTSNAVRRRLAAESAEFRCPACARPNADIMADAERRAQQAATPGAADVAVPSELRMGWRDEMEATKMTTPTTPPPPPSGPQPGGDNGDESDHDASDARLAEGFVATAPSAPKAPLQPATAQPLERPPAAPRRGKGVPLWIDRAIVTLVVLLAALLLKVLFGL